MGEILNDFPPPPPPPPPPHASDALWSFCHQALVQACAAFALLICKALFHSTEAVPEDLEAGSTTCWPAAARSLGLGDREQAHDAAVTSESEIESASNDADDENPVA
jgi:hypothetical protein